MLCSILLITGLATIFYLAYSFFLKPWVSLKYYKNQGCEMIFFPVLGHFKACQDTLESQGDFYGHVKNILKRNPKVKAIGGNLMSSPHVFLTDPNVITEFYKLQDKHYVKASSGLDLFKLLNGEGLGINDGEVWKRHRKVISQTFHFEFLKTIIPLISTLSSEMLESWKNQDLEDFELMRGLGDITGEVIGRAFFGTKFGEYRVCGKSLKHLITDVNGRLGAELFSPWYLIFGGKAIQYGLLPRYKQLMKDIGELQAFAKHIVEARRKVLKAAQEEGKPFDSNGATLLDSLLTASGFTDQEIIDEFITFTTAGMESTGRVIGNAIYNLSKKPQYKERLLEEANKHLKNHSQITIDNLNEMDFMNCVLKETLRFSIPDAVLIDRIATEDHVLHDLKIKKGTLVSISLEANMFNPDYYENADDFDPYRWIGDTKTKKAIAANPRVYLPFSAGGHTCIGQHLAMNEAKVIIGMFLQKFDFKLSPTYEHKMTVRMLYEPLNRMGFTLIPK